MSGKYNRVQALVKEKFGAVAEHVPCYAHSLNLVGVCAAQSFPQTVQFFDFVENIYSLYSMLLQHTGGPLWSV